ncbi:hypothetical protein OV079_37520 [Nannocystis pusilla]|uniref:Uncharacterized protein n=1 Tax=Nannocystis pusilla TaxID=889268 RepID=A0A9X3F424_9BACT|nr:hypothetical protein [Nannocystis pusilla]MCY1011163.1 hypothetical protein [Nannocystis pusilla]
MSARLTLRGEGTRVLAVEPDVEVVAVRADGGGAAHEVVPPRTAQCLGEAHLRVTRLGPGLAGELADVLQGDAEVPAVDLGEGLGKGAAEVGEQPLPTDLDAGPCGGQAGVVGVEEAVLLAARDAGVLAAEDAVPRAQELVVVGDVGDVRAIARE